MKNVMITGGTGFIGKSLVQELTDCNINVTMLVRDTSKINYDGFHNVDIIKYNPIHINDITTKLEREYDVFFHLGWGGVAPQDKNNIDMQIDNLLMSVEALRFANNIGCKTFIGAGTVAEYSFSNGVINFQEKQTPNDIYGASKVATHYMLEAVAKSLMQKFIWAIIPSTYGEGRRDNNIITYTIQSLLKNEKPQYGNLSQMWDFLYVSEVARALRMIGENGHHGKVYGIGSGVYRPLKEYIIEIRNIIDSNLVLGIGEKPELSEKTFSSCVNIDDLIKDTKFIPKISFDEGIKRTVEHYRNNL